MAESNVKWGPFGQKFELGAEYAVTHKGTVVALPSLESARAQQAKHGGEIRLRLVSGWEAVV